jgi:type IV pilus assembly protein PilA
VTQSPEAALAIFGVNRYLGAARSAEAKQNVGSISRAAAAAFDREATPGAILAAGATGSSSSRDLCNSATAVPVSVDSVKGKKYQPNAAGGTADFNAGSTSVGWSCLKFNIDQPMQYSVNYNKGNGGTLAGGLSAGDASLTDAAGTGSFIATAVGDTDGDTQYSAFGRRGSLLAGSGSASTLTVATDVEIVNEYE